MTEFQSHLVSQVEWKANYLVTSGLLSEQSKQLIFQELKVPPPDLGLFSYLGHCCPHSGCLCRTLSKVTVTCLDITWVALRLRFFFFFFLFFLYLSP